MTQNKKVKSNSSLTGMLFGTLAGMGILMIGSIVIALLINEGLMNHKTLAYAVMPVVMIGTFVGCLIASMLIKNQILLITLSVGGMMMLFMLAMTVIFFEGHFNGVPVTIALIIGSSLAAALVATRILNRSKSYYKKR